MSIRLRLTASALCACLLASLGSPARAAQESTDAGWLAVDIGHSLAQPGASSARGKPEFEFNLALGQELASQLQAQQLPFRLIGADGKLEKLAERLPLLGGSSFLLSLHHDSAQAQFLQAWEYQGQTRWHSPQFAGYSLFVSRKNPHLASSLRCARAIGSALQAAGFSHSSHHAAKINGENRPWADAKLGVYYFDDLYIVKNAPTPALLLEAGVIIQREEELKLEQSQTRQKIAQAIVAGLHQCRVLPKVQTKPG